MLNLESGWCVCVHVRGAGGGKGGGVSAHSCPGITRLPQLKSYNCVIIKCLVIYLWSRLNILMYAQSIKQLQNCKDKTTSSQISIEQFTARSTNKQILITN